MNNALEREEKLRLDKFGVEHVSLCEICSSSSFMHGDVGNAAFDA